MEQLLVLLILVGCMQGHIQWVLALLGRIPQQLWAAQKVLLRNT